MREYCTERVHPADAETVVNIMISFGWELIDSEEFYDENTQVSGVEVKMYGNDIFGGFMKGWTGNDGELNVKTYTTVTNYISLRFVRDTEISHYNKLCNLQNEFMHYLGEMRIPEKPKKFTLVGVLAILVSIIVAIMLLEEKIAGWWVLILPVFILAGSILTIVLSWRNYKKKEQYYYYVYSKAKSILEEAISVDSE